MYPLGIHGLTLENLDLCRYLGSVDSDELSHLIRIYTACILLIITHKPPIYKEWTILNLKTECLLRKLRGERVMANICDFV